MNKRKPFVYLAGKVGSRMIEIIRHNFRNDERFIFVSSAWRSGEVDGNGFMVDIYGNCLTCRRKLHECSCIGHGQYLDDHGFVLDGDCESRPHHAVATKLVNKSHLLLAAIDSDTAFGTIAEIGYAVGKNKPCFAWIYESSRQVVVHEDGSESPFKPGVHIVVNDEYGFQIAFDRKDYPQPREYFDHGCRQAQQHASRSKDTYRFVAGMCNETQWFSGLDADSKEAAMHCFCFFSRILDDHFGPIGASSLSECRSPIEEAYLKACHRARLYPKCQHSIGRFFVDFAFLEERVVIELDGHQYHKTKEQRTADAQRQRWLEMDGWKVVRFTGTEVHRNADYCVNQTVRFLEMARTRNGSNS